MPELLFKVPQSGFKKAEERSKKAGRLPQVTGHASKVTGQIPQVTGRASKITGQLPQVTGHGSKITGRVLKITGQTSKITGQLPPPSFLLSVSSVFILTNFLKPIP